MSTRHQNAPRASRYVTRARIFTSVTSLLLLISIPGASQIPLIGNSSAFGVPIPCLVACGSKGVVNLNFAGDAIDTFVFGSSINDFNDKMKALGDQFLAQAKQQLDAVLSDKITQLDKLADKQRAAL